MKVIVAPNTFKGSLSATQAAKAIARGVREVFPDAEVVEIPVADGGEGTVEALVSANRGTYEWVNVEGPLGDPVLASYGLIDGGKTAVVELASASGYVLVSPAMRDPRKTSHLRLRPAARGGQEVGSQHRSSPGSAARPPMTAAPGWPRRWVTGFSTPRVASCHAAAPRCSGSSASTTPG